VNDSLIWESFYALQTGSRRRSDREDCIEKDRTLKPKFHNDSPNSSQNPRPNPHGEFETLGLEFCMEFPLPNPPHV
jgi:hypothetical protein